MKTFATVLIAFDIFLLLLWWGGSGYILVNIETACFHGQVYPHFFILIHFVLGMYMACMVGEISKELHVHYLNNGRVLALLPYHFYQPLCWILTSLISLSGDIFLICLAALEYKHAPIDDCNTARILHIAFDTLALITSIISIVWFVIYSYYTIREDRSNIERL